MQRLALFLVLGLAACGEPGQDSGPPPDMQGWRLASGKAPSRAEYAAIVAACQEGAVRRSQNAPLDTCLAGLGLKRAP